jgi:hypothetical protein
MPLTLKPAPRLQLYNNLVLVSRAAEYRRAPTSLWTALKASPTRLYSYRVRVLDSSTWAGLCRAHAFTCHVVSFDRPTGSLFSWTDYLNGSYNAAFNALLNAHAMQKDLNDYKDHMLTAELVRYEFLRSYAVRYC